MTGNSLPNTKLRALQEFTHKGPQELKVIGAMRKLAQKARHSAKDYTNGVTRLDLAHSDLMQWQTCPMTTAAGMVRVVTGGL